jgi:large subunit ribosomal protein L30
MANRPDEEKETAGVAGEGTASRRATSKARPKKKAAPKKKVAKKKTTKKKTTKKAASGSASRLRVKQVRSTVRRHKAFKRTLEALGIKHHQGEVVVTDSPSTRGMLKHVRHLVSVTPEES